MAAKLLVICGALVSCVYAAAQSPASYPPCQVKEMSLHTGGKAEDFNGMSHSGTLLVLRNEGAKPCEFAPTPSISFADAKGALNIKPQLNVPRFMHPGPVVRSLILKPGKEATLELRWVSGSVFPDSVCIDPTHLSLSIEGKPLHTSIQAHLCGDRTKGIACQVSRFSLAEH